MAVRSIDISVISGHERGRIFQLDDALGNPERVIKKLGKNFLQTNFIFSLWCWTHLEAYFVSFNALWKPHPAPILATSFILRVYTRIFTTCLTFTIRLTFFLHSSNPAVFYTLGRLYCALWLIKNLPVGILLNFTFVGLYDTLDDIGGVLETRELWWIKVEVHRSRVKIYYLYHRGGLSFLERFQLHFGRRRRFINADATRYPIKWLHVYGVNVNAYSVSIDGRPDGKLICVRRNANITRSYGFLFVFMSANSVDNSCNLERMKEWVFEFPFVFETALINYY